jgi:hypothetical protein
MSGSLTVRGRSAGAGRRAEMQLRKHSSNVTELGGEAGAKRRRPERRGWGPFTGRQLTIVVVALVFGVVAYPFAAGAASAAFTSASNAIPAVKGTNSGSAGTGVQGTGKKYGVYSNGPLGVAAGKPLSCAHCVSAGDLSTAIRTYDPLDAEVSFNGTLLSGHHVVSVAHLAGGIYEVTFDRDISQCTLTASAQNADPAVASPYHGGGAKAEVNITLADNSLGDRPFGLLVTC